MPKAKTLKPCKLKGLGDQWVTVKELADVLDATVFETWVRYFRNQNAGFVMVAYYQEDGKLFCGGLSEDGQKINGDYAFGTLTKFCNHLYEDIYITFESAQALVDLHGPFDDLLAGSNVKGTTEVEITKQMAAGYIIFKDGRPARWWVAKRTGEEWNFEFPKYPGMPEMNPLEVFHALKLFAGGVVLRTQEIA